MTLPSAAWQWLAIVLVTAVILGAGWAVTDWVIGLIASGPRRPTSPGKRT